MNATTVVPLDDRSGPSLFWFRRDLRLADQPALAAAASHGPVLGVFVVDPDLVAASGSNRLAFLAGCLVELDRSMGHRLVVRSGRPTDVLADLAAEVGAVRVVATDDHGSVGRRRDDQVGRDLADRGLAVHYRDSAYAVTPGTIRTGGGTPYQVFTPFFRAWQRHGWPDPMIAPEVDWIDGVGSDTIEWPSSEATLPAPGEAAANEALDAFVGGALDGYDRDRDRPGVEGTSRLSAHLKFGTIHPRQVLALVDPAGVFASQICWRDFYADVVFHRPASTWSWYQAQMADLEVDTGAEADARFEAWAEGRTGYPIVDAGMRQLLAEGWMHNRVRMITASFLVKDLHLDWRRGAAHFLRHLVDGDVASNQHGWQWVAGSGPSASPWFRVFNPVGQGKKFDLGAVYIRRWVPEIGHLDDHSIHEPWTHHLGPPAGYPGPIVDHAAERLDALRRLDDLKQARSRP